MACLEQGMNEKIILVTGATDGIGKATAMELARHGARVIVHGRKAEKVAQIQAEIGRFIPGNKVETAVADLSSLSQVRSLARYLTDHFERLDVLLHNAGVFMKQRQLSADGFEMTFAVNHLAPFLLTHELLPLLRASQARVITVSSGTHHRGRINFDDLQAERQFDGYAAYSQSKLANILFANELAQREQGTITSNALHPGVINTNLLREGFGGGGDTVEKGAATSVYLALSPEVANTTGKYFSNSRETPVAAHALDQATQQRLWQVSSRLAANL